MKAYTLRFSEEEMEFLRQLAQSQIPITMQAAKVAANIQEIVLTAKPDGARERVHVPDAVHEPG